MRSAISLLLICCLHLQAQSIATRHRQVMVAPFPNPTSYWNMDQAANSTRTDTYGVNDLVDLNSSVAQVAGLINNAASFGAVSSQQLKPTTPITVASGTAWSLSMWVKCSTFTNQGFMGNLFTSGSHTRFFTNSSTQLTLADDGNVLASVTPSPALSTGAWHNLIFAIGADKSGKAYIDGTTYTFAAAGVYTGGWTLREFGQIGGNTFPTSCAIDGVGYWNGVKLTAGNATYIYNSGAGRDL